MNLEIQSGKNDSNSLNEIISQNFDARVVQTVRNLKKIPSRYSDGNNPNKHSSESTSSNNTNKNSKSTSEKLSKSPEVYN